MKTLLKIILPLAAIAIGVLIKQALTATAPELGEQVVEAYVPSIKAITVEKKRHQIIVPAYGVVQSQGSIALIAKTQGELLSVNDKLRRGGKFKKGEILASIDSSDLEIALTMARASLQQALAQHEIEQAAAELAVADWKRISSDTPSDITARRPQLSLATAAVDAAAAQVALSQLNLSRCKLTAPFDGRVLNLKAESGQWLAPGSVVADLQPTTGAEVNIPLNEGQLKLLQLPTSGDCRDLEVTAIIPGQHQSVSAKLIRISSQLEQGTRMTQAVAQLPDGLHIPPHTYLELFINGPTVDDAIKLPTAAVDGGFAFVVNNDSTLDIVELNIIQQTNDHFFVSGLEDGQLVSITPLSVFVPGMQIEVNNN